MKMRRRSSVVQSQQIDATKRRALVVVIWPGPYERSSRWRQFDVVRSGAAAGIHLYICCANICVECLTDIRSSLQSDTFRLIFLVYFPLRIQGIKQTACTHPDGLLLLRALVCARCAELQAAAGAAAVLISLLPLCWRLRGDSWCQFRGATGPQKNNLLVVKITPFGVARFIRRRWKRTPVKSNHWKACKAR